MFLPDFWCKEIDPSQNSVTPSAVWWQWQDPSKKVLEAINKEGHLRIETVCKEVEYVVVLVKKGETESGIPIDVPRTNRPRAFDYFQKLFPEYVVSRVCRLHGAEAANEVFDNRSFRHQTNPLFVELRSQVPKTNTPVIGFTNAATNMDKGKGKSVTT
ncbi:hypothetical protein M408DRAFT_30507 [Serendipita vermifera MAFF 305830]|uniref:Uncharacterized protein n=1 Tax=Serendipita vermifera MAFF 305830 TaxID=933852 RepID=A0A0C3A6J3_SERVB|nr:hypothetical protein M408DRAFT_30507 [Serendipita vermifera MAFF 305830]